VSAAQRIYDVSVLVHSGMAVYPGDPPVDVSLVFSQAAGDPANVSRLSFGIHSGTHVDAPYHVDATWHALSPSHLGTLLGPARVVQLDVQSRITAADLAPLPWDGVERVLFKTRNSALWNGEFQSDYVSLSPDAAAFLVERTRVRLVGIDYFSIEPVDSPDLAVHRTLLGRDVLVVEGLYLEGVEPGDYQFLCLPLKLSAPDGAPVRALLVQL